MALVSMRREVMSAAGVVGKPAVSRLRNTGTRVSCSTLVWCLCVRDVGIEWVGKK